MRTPITRNVPDLNEFAEHLASTGLPETEVNLIRGLSADARHFFYIQIAKNIANIDQAENVRVGDIAGVPPETLRRAISEALFDQDLSGWIAALEDYWSALESFSERLPYFDTADGRQRLLSEVYIEQQAEERLPASFSPGSGVTPRGAERVETVGEALKHHRHILIEAGPGLGKTCLLQTVVHDAAYVRKRGEGPGFIPVLVPARALVQHEGSLSARLHAQMIKQLGFLLRRDLPRGFFEERAEGPTWLVLLDGLDEVIGESARDELVEAICFHVRRSESSYRFVITSRPIDWASVLQADVHRYVLRALNPGQVTLFAEQWFAGRSAAGAGDAALFLDQAAQSRISDLTKIPLLLTMAAFVFERSRERRLPRSRAALYERFVAVLLDGDRMKETHEQFRIEWDKRFPGKGIPWIDTLFRQRRFLLEHLARKQHEQGTISLSEQGLAFARQSGLFSAKTVDDTVWLKDQISLLLARSGLVIHHAGDEAFLHPTFREFLMASALSREIDPGSPGAHSLLTKWTAAEWREIVLFVIQLWGEHGKSVEAALRFALNEIKEGHFLAGLAVAEGTPVAADLEGRIIAELIKHARTARVLDMLRYRALGASPADILGRLHGRPGIASSLDEIARDRRVLHHVREEVTSALGQLGEGARLRSLLQARDMWPGVRREAARELGLLGAQEEALPFLVTLGLCPKGLGNDQVWDAYYAVKALIEIGRPKEAVPLLVNIARSRDYFFLSRNYAARDLFDLGREDAARLLLLRQAAEPEAGVDYVVQIGSMLAENKSLDLGLAILRQVAGDPDDSLEYRSDAARRLAGLGCRSEAISFLHSMLPGGIPAESPYWGNKVAEVLADIGSPVDFDLGAVLRQFSVDRRTGPGQRLRAASVLVGQGHEEAISALSDIASETSVPTWIREEARSHIYQHRWRLKQRHAGSQA